MLVQVVVGWLFRSATGTKVFDVDGFAGSAFLDAHETVIGVSLVVGAADRLVFLWTHFGATLKAERGQASLQWNNEYVLAAVGFSHVAFRFVEIVVRAADETPRVFITLGFTMGRRYTVLQRHRDYSETTGLLPHLTKGFVSISVRTANWSRLFVLG